MTIEEKSNEYWKLFSFGLSKAHYDSELEEAVKSTFIAGAKEATRWILVEESLPDEEGQYLVKHNGNIMLLWFNPHYECWDDADGDDYVCDLNDIEAWRPIEFE